MSEKPGVLPVQDIQALFDAGFITDIGKKYLNPASLDLPLSAEAYRIGDNFLPRPGEKVRTLLELVGARRHDLSAPLEVGVSYLVRVEGSIQLPQGIKGYANPKSSTGRLNIYAVVVADGVSMYDALPFGWGGELWVLVTPKSFPVLTHPGLPLCQLRLFDGTSFLDSLEISVAIKKDGLLFAPDGHKLGEEEYQTHGDSFYLSLLVQPGVVGWECRGTNHVLDMSKVGHHDPEEFFTPVEAPNGVIRLHAGSFYILSTREFVRVPPHLSAELRAMDPRMGEHRAHTAGYIDAGWGHGENGEVPGRPITLEFVMFQTRMFRAGENVVRIRYERMRGVPAVAYDTAESNYTNQGAAMLSKHFRQT